MVEITDDDVEAMGSNPSQTDEIAREMFGTRAERQERAIEGAIRASDDWQNRQDILEDIKTNSLIGAPASEVGIGPTGEPATEVLGGGSGGSQPNTTNTGGTTPPNDNASQSPRNTYPPSSPAPTDPAGEGPTASLVGLVVAVLVGVFVFLS
jgi:hypothetical protein